MLDSSPPMTDPTPEQPAPDPPLPTERLRRPRPPRLRNPLSPVRPRSRRPVRPHSCSGGRRIDRTSPFTWVVSLALAAIVGALLFVGGYLAAGATGAGSCAAPNEAFTSFCEAYGKLKDQYVDQPRRCQARRRRDPRHVRVRRADPFSGYMSPEDYRRALGDLSGQFSGIGAEMGVKNLDDPGNLDACDQFSDSCVLVVVAPLQDSPAEKAGLQPGDIITGHRRRQRQRHDPGRRRPADPRRVRHRRDDHRPERGERQLRPDHHPRRDPDARGDHQDAGRQRRLRRAARLLGRGLRPVPRRHQAAARRRRDLVHLRPAQQPRRLHRGRTQDRLGVHRLRPDLHARSRPATR